MDVGFFLDQQGFRHQIYRRNRFSAKNTLNFNTENSWFFLLELLYPITETKYGVQGFVQFTRFM